MPSLIELIELIEDGTLSSLSYGPRNVNSCPDLITRPSTDALNAAADAYTTTVNQVALNRRSDIRPVEGYSQREKPECCAGRSPISSAIAV